MFLASLTVIVTELFNSAIEFTLDAYYKNKFSNLVKMAKEVKVKMPTFKTSSLIENPEIMNNVGAEGQSYDPEICFRLKYKGDENNRAYTMQYTNDGAEFVNHPVDALPDAIRWISRTLNEDSMGMVLPCTAEHLGYTHAKNNGQIKILPPNETLFKNPCFIRPDLCSASC